MRVWLRSWLGIDADCMYHMDWRKDHETRITDLTEMVMTWRDELSKIRDTNRDIIDRINKMEASLLPPIPYRMAQLQTGARLLTEFANEIQREIDAKVP